MKDARTLLLLRQEQKGNQESTLAPATRHDPRTTRHNMGSNTILCVAQRNPFLHRNPPHVAIAATSKQQPPHHPLLRSPPHTNTAGTHTTNTLCSTPA